MENKVDVLIDRQANEISLVTVGDDGTEHETSLSLEAAWDLVCEINRAIHKLKPIVQAKPSRRVPSKSRVHDAASNNPEQLRDAVLESVGSNQYAYTAR